MKRYKLLSFNQLGDSRGNLIALEGMKNIPFEIKRIFYIYETDQNIIRGQHANKKSEFVLINLAGNCKVKIDDGKNKETITLNKASEGIYIDKMVWKDMYDFSKDSILLVLSNQPYDSEEYVKNYIEFKKEIEKIEGEK